MHRNKTFIILICILIPLIVGMYITAKNATETRPANIKASTGDIPSTVTQKASLKKPKFECQKPKKQFEDETYLDVGQTTPLLDTSYVPADLIQLDKTITKSPICLRQEAADALSELIADAKKDGYTITVTSGFRSYETQQALYAANLKASKSKTSISVAKPGYSEHQLGVTVDLTSPTASNASAASSFGNTPEFEWLAKHAAEYGFLESYPEGKEARTGYMYEPWHYRYVGIENAKEILKNDQTINEFLKESNKKEPAA